MKNLKNEIIVDELFPPFSLSYEDFYEKYLCSNKPCILRGFLDSSNWAASKDWVKDGKPNMEFFVNLFTHDHNVPVSLCNSKYFNSQECVTQTLQDYMQYWKEEERKELNYLKDWHFVADCRKLDIDYMAYTVPEYFKSDWLNEWLENRKLENEESRSDYRFVYIGPKDSFTPFHSDVFGSFSWSANIIGIKEWIFVAPGEENKVELSPANYIHDIESLESQKLQVTLLLPNTHTA